MAQPFGPHCQSKTFADSILSFCWLNVLNWNVWWRQRSHAVYLVELDHWCLYVVYRFRWHYLKHLDDDIKGATATGSCSWPVRRLRILPKDLLKDIGRFHTAWCSHSTKNSPNNGTRGTSPWLSRIHRKGSQPVACLLPPGWGNLRILRLKNSVGTSRIGNPSSPKSFIGTKDHKNPRILESLYPAISCETFPPDAGPIFGNLPPVAQPKAPGSPGLWGQPIEEWDGKGYHWYNAQLFN